jgi:hypothetical protein
MIAAITTNIAPMTMEARRPRLSATYEAGMKDRKAPSETAATMRPVAFELSSLKNMLTAFLSEFSHSVRWIEQNVSLTLGKHKQTIDLASVVP